MGTVLLTGCSSGACSHDYGEWITINEANCIVQKEERRNCLLCNRIETRRVGEPILNAHDWEWTEDAVEPTCTERGGDTATCKNAGCEVTNERRGSNALGHEGVTNAIKMTCQTEGNTGIGICTRCQQTVIGTVIPIDPDAHEWSPRTYDAIAATCTERSKHIRTCEIPGCDVIEEIPGAVSLGHNWSDWEINIGSISKKTCSRCTEKINGAIGDTGPGGGKIFYVAEAGFDLFTGNTTANTTSVKAYYLEAAPADMPTQLVWASVEFQNTDIPGTSQDIGTGRKNMTLILAIDSNAPAARACRNYRAPFPHNNLTDWFLPSRHELQQLYINRYAVGNFRADLNSQLSYWSSSQSSSGHARFQRFDDGSPSTTNKHVARLVRAVRAF